MKRDLGPVRGQREAVAETISRFAAENRRIRRAWLVGDAAKGSPGNRIGIAIEVEPVGDSEETLAVWLANEGRWQAQLQLRLSRDVGLEWVDTDATHTARSQRDEAKLLVYERVRSA